MAGLDANTKLLLHGNAPDGTFEVVDNGNTGHVVTQIATAQLSTAEKKFGSTSLLLDGNSDYLTIPDSPDFDIFANLTDDYTLDMQVIAIGTTGQAFLYFHNDGSEVDYVLLSYAFASGQMSMQLFIGGVSQYNMVFVESGLFTDGLFHHIAFIKVGSNTGLYVDGVQKSYLVQVNTGVVNKTLTIGTHPSALSLGLNGNIDELRLQKSNYFNASPVVGLTDTITVPTQEYISDVNTKLLLHMNTQDVSGDGGSGNYHIPDFIGTAQIDTAQFKFGGSSYLFDGNSDYLTIPDSADWDWFVDNNVLFTIDFWIKKTTDATQWIMGQGISFANEMNFFFLTDKTLLFRVDLADTQIVDLNSGIDAITDTNWHHIVIVIIGNGSLKEFGMYIDGVQVAYDSTASNQTFSSPLIIGARWNASSFFTGQMDEIRVQKANYFNASPVVGLTDTITVPTQEYSFVSTLNTFNANQGIIII